MRGPEALLVDLMQRPMRDPRETPQQLADPRRAQTWQGRSTPQEGDAIAAAMRELGVTPKLFTDGTTSSATYTIAREGLQVRWSRTGGLCTLTVALTR